MSDSSPTTSRGLSTVGVPAPASADPVPASSRAGARELAPSATQRIASSLVARDTVDADRLAAASAPNKKGNTSRPGVGKGTANPTDTSADRIFLLGWDWGTHTSSVFGAYASGSEIVVKELIPTIVGYAKEGLVQGLLPGNASVLFGQEALNHRLHLHLVPPLARATVSHPEVARAFASHIRACCVPEDATQVRVVVGIPAGTSAGDREAVRKALAGSFDRVMLVPLPFLTAVGCRERQYGQKILAGDPAKNSVFVDIGASTTGLCLVQGGFPGPEEQSMVSAGCDQIDLRLLQALQQVFPESRIPANRIRDIKERHAFVGSPSGVAKEEIVIQGQTHRVDFTQVLGQSCQELVAEIFQGLKKLIRQADPESVKDLVQHIFLTGGGSLIRNIDGELQRMLSEDGIENPKVRVVGEEFKTLAALGALKASQHAREDQWQLLVK